MRLAQVGLISNGTEQCAGAAPVKMASPPPYPATKQATAAGYFETELVLATAASIWIAAAAVLASAVLDAIR